VLQQTTKWLPYYKCLKSDMFSTKSFKSDMLITSQWFFYSFVSGSLCSRGHGTRWQGVQFNEKWTKSQECVTVGITLVQYDYSSITGLPN
jgi:hypothetical protein